MSKKEPSLEDNNLLLCEVSLTSPVFKDVISLWRRNSDTLGYLPRGAFEQHASEKRILAIVKNNADSNLHLLGYLLYRIARSRAVIVHLCVDVNSRSLGVARKLVSELQRRVAGLRSIDLHCRRDFEANKLWPRVGFIPVAEKLGKNKNQNPLTLWRYSFGHPNLFTVFNEEIDKASTTISVAIDTNILIDLQSDPTTNESEESHALKADWLTDIVRLVITDEVLVDLNRNEKKEIRSRGRNFAANFDQLTPNNDLVAQSELLLKEVFNQYKQTDQTISDIRHIAKVSSTECKFFVTRDNDLLTKFAEGIYEKTGVKVLSPAGLISEIDELRDSAQFQPFLLRNKHLRMRLIKAQDIQNLARRFLKNGERLFSLETILRSAIINRDAEAWIIESDEAVLGIFVQSFVNLVSEVTFCRVAKSPQTSTICKYLSLKFVEYAFKRQCSIVVVKKSSISEDLSHTLLQDGYLEQDNCFNRITLAKLLTLEELRVHLEALTKVEGCQVYENICQQISKVATSDTSLIYEIEKRFWPCKVKDAEIPTFIVPIQPIWAKHLFDHDLANQELFGSSEDHALQREGAYYRSAHNNFLKAPSRILWYVSSTNQAGFRGTSAIRACSFLDSVTIDIPKSLYKRNQRLGIYEWENVFDLAGKDLTKKIMVLNFSDTILFQTPIPLLRVQQILKKKNSIAGPVRISCQQFAEIYSYGQNS